jgi:hypothetical protein
MFALRDPGLLQALGRSRRGPNLRELSGGSEGETTMSQEFRVWASEDDEKGATLVINCRGAEEAAREFVKGAHADFDYADEVEVLVRDSAGNLSKWVVTAEETIVFHANQVP